MKDEERDSSTGQPAESFGSAPADGGTGTFGDAPRGDETMGSAPKAGPSRNVGLLIGGGVAILVVLAAVFGFLIR